MLRRIMSAVALLASALCLVAPAAQAATPLLYVYEGAGCTGVAALPQFRAFIGRQEDGVVEFDNYLADWPGAVAAANWGLWCWKGNVKNVALAVRMRSPTEPIPLISGPPIDIFDVITLP